MTKRKAQLVYAPPPKRSKSEATYSSVKGSIQRGIGFEAATRKGAKSKYKGLWCFEGARGEPTRWAVPVATPQGVKAPPMDWAQGPTPGFKGREPYFIARSIRSEVEAALLRDIATLWLKLHEKGCTPAKLAAVKWNFQCMQLWKEQSGAIKPLQRVAPQDRSAAQKAVRSLTTKLLPRLHKRLVPDYAVHRVGERKDRKAAVKKTSDQSKAGMRKVSQAADARRKAAQAKEKTAQRAARAIAAAVAQAKAAEAARAKAAEAARAKRAAGRVKAVAQRKREAAAAAQAAREKQVAAAAQRKERADRATVRAGKRIIRVRMKE